MLEQLSIFDLPPSENPPPELFKHHRVGASSCIGCGCSFTKLGNEKYCTTRCRRRFKKRRRVEKYGRRPDLYEPCACGGLKTRGAKFCRSCTEKPKRNKPTRVIVTKHCHICGQSFEVKMSRQKTCGNEKCRQKSKRLANPEKYSGYARRWLQRQRESDPFYRVKNNIRRRIIEALRCGGIAKSQKTFQMLGYSPEELKRHLENQFIFGMSWNNYGKEWHVDHVKPVSMHVMSSQRSIRQCWSLNNLKPRWATNEISMRHGFFQEGNIEKSNRYVG